MVVPATIADAGETAACRFLEFFAATIRNRNTRMASYRAVRHFFAWSEHHQLGGLDEIEPLHIAAYVEQPPFACMNAAISRRMSQFSMSISLAVGDRGLWRPPPSGQERGGMPPRDITRPLSVATRHIIGPSPIPTADSAGARSI